MKKGIQTHIQVAVLTNSHHDVVLQPKVTLGSLHQIQSISPLEPLKLADEEKRQLVPQSQPANTKQNQQEVFSVGKMVKSTDDHIQKILREVDLQRLNEKEREQAFKLLREEADVFCLDSDDIGSVTESKMKTQLKDQTPVQKIYLDVESRPLTAFITPWGRYEWVRVPFELTNAPVEFQRFMESTLFDMRDEFAFPYLHDTLVFSDTFDDHSNHLKKVFQRLREKGIRIKASKCKLFQRQVNCLGRVISSDGYQIDQANIKAVTDLLNQKPRTVGKVRRLLGLLAYYKRYIESFAKIAQLLYDLLKKPVSASSQVPTSSKSKILKQSKQRFFTVKVINIYCLAESSSKSSQEIDTYYKITPIT